MFYEALSSSQPLPWHTAGDPEVGLRIAQSTKGCFVRMRSRIQSPDLWALFCLKELEIYRKEGLAIPAVTGVDP